MFTHSRNAKCVIAVWSLIALAAPFALAQNESARPSAEHPTVSPDGTKIVFSVSSDNGRHLWIVDADSSHAVRLTSWATSDEKEPSWSRDGMRVALSSTRDSDTHHIWIVGADGSRPQQVTSGDAEHEYPRFSPDGSQISFLSNATGKRELWITRLDDLTQRVVAASDMLVSDPTWSPDGTQIAFVGCRRAERCNLFRINADGSGAVQLTDGDFQDWTPDWGDSGIVFASDRNDDLGLWVIQADGTGLQQLTAPDGAGDLDPRWISGGTGLVFTRSGVSDADGGAEVWLAAIAGAAPVQLTHIMDLVETSVDRNPPVMIARRTPAPNALGWNNSPVVVEFECIDPESGLAPGSPPAPTTLSAQGGHQSVVGVCQDLAGNIASTTVGDINIDVTPPMLTVAMSPVPNSSGWNNSPTTVSFVAEDALSGVAIVSGPINVEAEGRGQVLTATAIDNAGNVAIGQATVNVDLTPPEAYFQFDPITREVMLFGRDQLSGVAAAAVPPLSVRIVASNGDDLSGEDGLIQERHYSVLDRAGNATIITTREVRHTTELLMSIVNIQYGHGSVVTMKSNEARFEWHAQNAGELELEQRITVESGLSRVRAEYDFASGRTRIEEVHGETRTRTDDVGLVLVQLVTRNGALVVEY